MIKYGVSTQVGKTNINVYTKGEGSATIVFLAGSGIGCPGLEYKPLYKRLSDKYRIAVIEKAGYGLSGKAETERSSRTDSLHIHIQDLKRYGGRTHIRKKSKLCWGLIWDFPI